MSDDETKGNHWKNEPNPETQWSPDETHEQNDEKQGISLLTGVIMMIAATVILGSLVGSVFLDISDSPRPEHSEPTDAQVTVNQIGTEKITITYQDGNADHLIVKCPNQVDILKTTSDSTTITDIKDGDKITVYAVNNGNKKLIKTYII